MIKNLISLFSRFILSSVLKKKNIILLTGTDYYIFNENSKYLYLSLSKSKIFFPIWITSDQEIFDYLKERDLNVIKKKRLSSLIYFFGAKILIGTGESLPIKNFFLSNDCVKINLRHGYGPRSNGASFKIVNNKIIHIRDDGKSYESILSQWDYINYTNKNISKVLGEKFKIHKKKRVILGFQRCYQYSDKKKNEMRNHTKNYLNELGFDKNKKFILYAPTWRINKNNLPIENLKGFVFYKFNNFLKLKNIQFLINTHYHDKLRIKNYSNINFLERNSFFDIYDILPEIDLLITDYSSIATDFLLLKKKIIHLLPDNEEYLKNMSLLTKLEEINCGPIVKDYNNLIKELDNFRFIQNKKIKKYINFYTQNNKHNYESNHKFIKKLI